MCNLSTKQSLITKSCWPASSPSHFDQIWEDISLDFMDGLPRSLGVDIVLVVVDRLSKYAHFVGLKHPYTTQSVANVFVKEVVRHHGVPAKIVCDSDKVFLSLF